MQIDTAESNASKLSLVQPLLGDLISLAKDEIVALCAEHHFEYTPSSGGGVAVAFKSSCASSVHLYPPPSPRGKIHNSVDTAIVFANLAMQQFGDKVNGTGDIILKRRKEEIKEKQKSEEDSRASSRDCGGDSMSVPEYVEALIEEATSVDKLARMYEGWMPWV